MLLDIEYQHRVIHTPAEARLPGTWITALSLINWVTWNNLFNPPLPQFPLRIRAIMTVPSNCARIKWVLNTNPWSLALHNHKSFRDLPPLLKNNLKKVPYMSRSQKKLSYLPSLFSNNINIMLFLNYFQKIWKNIRFFLKEDWNKILKYLFFDN